MPDVYSVFQSSFHSPLLTFILIISQAHTAGITVKMITGDSPDTARAIALALDIVARKDAEAISGPQVCVYGCWGWMWV